MNICSFIIVAILTASIGFEVDSKKDFIIAELIHRDSYMSQLNNSLKITTLLDRINNFNSSSIHDIDARDIESEVTLKGGGYFMKINTGGQEKLLVLFTTLAFTLMFGYPCDGCHEQDKPRFLTNLANTKNFPSKSTECRLLRSYMRVSSSGSCDYLRDERELNTLGVISRVTSSFGSSSGSGTEGGQFNLWFVRVFKSERDRLDRSVEGLVGLGPGPYSLITQLAGQLKIAKKFSYCLLNPYKKLSHYSKIIFGEKTSTSTGKVTIPFVTQYAKPYYFLSLRAITVSNEREEKKILMKGHDNILIVCEEMRTRLPSQTYDTLAQYIKLFTDDGGVVVPDDKFSLCYDNLIVTVLPRITLEFDNGATIKLPLGSTYIESQDGRKICLTIESAKSSFPVLGTHLQHDFEVEYDVDKSEVSFAEANCNKFGIQ